MFKSGVPTVLVCEPSAPIRDVIALGLGRAGIRTLTAATHRDAKELTECSPRIDLLLIDAQFSMTAAHIQGSDVRTQFPDARVIYLTDSWDASRLNEMVLEKPFRMSELVATIQRVLSEAPDCPI